jgi:hypothetical protein
MKARGCRRDPYGLLMSLTLVAWLMVAGCGGAGPQASLSATSGTATAAPAPAASPPGRSASRWDAPGSATLAQTLAATRRYAVALHAERIPAAGLYVSDATWDHWASGGSHVTGASVIERIYRDAAPYLAAGAAVGDAFANGDPAALRAVVSPDVLFNDTAQAHGAKGWKVVLRWWTNVPDVELRNEEPIAGAGWVVDRWTVRQVLATGEEKTVPGATVMEVRRGKVIRMTLYYDAAVIGLQQ